MTWYLIHSKPRQEFRALENLQAQGFHCYLPQLRVERLRRKRLQWFDEPLFPRYLFIRLGGDDTPQDWSPIRSTLGVSRLVRFGDEPARVDDALIAFLQQREAKQNAPEPLFKAGERVQLTSGPFAGFEGVFQMSSGEQRALVLIEFLNKPVKVSMAPAELRKIS
ncbi:MAG: transcription/translation regulatory transformer protein RfaH [Gammaproteobacteria bacterium SHHR-1]|uniref:transcription/translation regulatory transformer protein RfaH n=1 Tax=Magnetovirga frankeli TaxID=947516 RepID=UPI001293A3F7|nr:transcription/translation regulatory transformer protein RfaH [gamma proteobacterium SS-5]